MSEQQKLFASLSGALVAHLIFFLLVFGFLSTRSANSSSRHGSDPAEVEKEPEEVTILMSELMEQIEIVPAPPVAPVPLPENSRAFVATDLNSPEASAPLNARYQSDRNTSAASALQPDETLPQRDDPTLQGKNPLSRPTLVDREFAEGEEPATVSENTAVSDDLIEARDEFLDRLEQQVTANTKKSFFDPSSDINISDPSTMTQEDDRLGSQGEERNTSSGLKPAEGGISAGFSPEERQNTINGNPVKTGRNAVDAEETPLGRYQKSVQDAISRMWHRYRQEKGDSAMWGILKFEFKIDREGGVNNLQIMKNEANTVVARFPLDVIREAKLPPMPDDVAESVGAQGLVIQYDIIIY